MFVLHLSITALGMLLVLMTLPLLLELLVLSCAAWLPARATPADGTGQIRLAVIVPAHNEEMLIGACVKSILRSATPHVTAYVIAHNCTDGTAQRAREAGAHVFTLLDATGGKGAALDFGFTEAVRRGAEAVFVVDADSIIGVDALARVSGAFAAGVEALQCRYEVGNAGANRRTQLTALALLGVNVLRPLGRSRMGLSCGLFGNGFGMRKEVLARVPYGANSLVEDLEYHLHLVRAGVRVHFLKEAAVYGEMPETSAAAASQRARWEGGRLRMRRLWTWPLAALVLRGRLRLLEPLLDLLALPVGSEVAWLGLALLVGAASGTTWLAAYGVLGFAVVAGSILGVARLSPQPWDSLKTMAVAPGYLLWKLALLPKTRRAAREDAVWVRTARNIQQSHDQGFSGHSSLGTATRRLP